MIQIFFFLSSKVSNVLFKGNRLIPIITNCSCVQPHCYRKVHFESFPEEYIDAKGNTASRIKVWLFANFVVLRPNGNSVPFYIIFVSQKRKGRRNTKISFVGVAPSYFNPKRYRNKTVADIFIICIDDKVDYIPISKKVASVMHVS